ncbi:hypothetical protein ACTMTJ_18975 [Phytohabitans sp. LJ34]|uniref:hypothetical protein n=1 Tax=Phytohabitans sp. LJ34 TaxID=3452217 RepID=UPI003F886A25
MATQWTPEPRPDEMALRDWLRPWMDAAIVCEIAKMDYGMRVEEYRREIEELLVVRHLPAELDWNPREVLALTSSWRPDEPRGHIARLFACMVLVRADDTPAPADQLAALVESALALGPDATDAAVRFLAWCRQQVPGTWRYDAEARPFLSLGLLLVYAAGRPDPAVVAELAREVGVTDRASLRKSVGGDEWRTWRALVGRYPSLDLPHDWFTTQGR